MMSRFVTVFFLLTFSAVSYGSPKVHETHIVKRGETITSVAKQFGLTKSELLAFNNLKSNDRFRVGRKLVIPFPGETGGFPYVVKDGDSIESIAQFYSVSISQLQKANGLNEGDAIWPNDTIVIPFELRGGATKGHFVAPNETLQSISGDYGVSIRDLAWSNRLSIEDEVRPGQRLIIPLTESKGATYAPSEDTSMVKSGEKVDGGVVHTVMPGQTLAIIANAYKIESSILTNGIREFELHEKLPVGRRLIVPGAKKVVAVPVEGVVARPIRFVRTATKEEISLRLVNFEGKVIPRSRKLLSQFSGPVDSTERFKLFDPRLITLIQKVADHFGGNPIEVISGYRPYVKGEKTHNHSKGQAIDLRIVGVDNTELFNFLKDQEGVGVGLYPKANFVHMDVRDESGRWIDMSGQGEHAKYVSAAEYSQNFALNLKRK